MTTYRLVIFDFDGTLADSFPWFLGAVGRAAALYGVVAPPASELETWRTLDARTIIRRLGVPMWQVPAIVRQSALTAVSVVPGAGLSTLLFAIRIRM